MSKIAVLRRCGLWSPILGPMALVLAILVWATDARPSAQAPLWQVKDVAALDVGPVNCQRYPRVNGFDFAPDGTPIVGWTQVEGCGGNNWTAWAEERDGAWQTNVFPPPSQGTLGSHEMALGGDGQPYMFLERHVNSYYDVVVADLRALAAGAPGVVATGEGLGPSCVYTRFRLATVPGQALPSRAMQLSFCSGTGPLRLDGTNLVENFTNRGHDFAVGPTGQAHIAYVDGGGGVYYLRPGRTPVLVANVNRFSDDVAIAEGGDGVIHLAVRGFESGADYDRGRLGYLRSNDDGVTWSFVDYVDVQRPQWGLSLQVDADGQPALAYWYYNQLIYATRASGAWVKSLVAEPTWENTEWLKQPRLRFDAAGIPHIAYYDWTANRIRVAAPAFYEPPTITNPGAQISAEGDTVSLSIDGTVGEGKIRGFTATGLPPGLSIQPTTGQISGTLSPGSAGSYAVTVTISDAVTDVSEQFVWTVGAPRVLTVIAGAGTTLRVVETGDQCVGGDLTSLFERTCAFTVPFGIHTIEGTTSLASPELRWQWEVSVNNFGQNGPDRISLTIIHDVTVRAGLLAPFTVNFPDWTHESGPFGEVTSTLPPYQVDAPGFSCSVAQRFCQGLAPLTSTVALTAVPASTGMLATWGGACSGSQPGCSLFINPGAYVFNNGPIVAAALFEPRRVPVAVVAGPGVTISAAGVADRCEGFDITGVFARTCTLSLPIGTALLTASSFVTPSQVRWLGRGGEVTSPTLSFPVFEGGHGQVEARLFVPFVVQVQQPSYGAVSRVTSMLQAADYSCDATRCEAYAPFNSPVTLTAVPGDAWRRFQEWGGACAGTAPTCTFIANSQLAQGGPGLQSATALFVPYQPSQLANPGAQQSTEGETVALPLTWSVEPGRIPVMQADGLPPGLVLHSTTFTIGGSLDAGSAGTYPVTITLQDGATEARVSFTWTVTTPPPMVAPALTLTTGYDYHASYGVESAVEIVASASNPGATLLPLIHSVLPPGATLTKLSGDAPAAAARYRMVWTPFPEFNADGSRVITRAVCFSIADSLGFATLGNRCATFSIQQGGVVELYGTIRDFSAGHLDFNRELGDLGASVVGSSLGAGRKPVFAPAAALTTIENADSFAQWWRDGAHALSSPHRLVMSPATETSPLAYVYESSAWRPHTSPAPPGAPQPHGAFFTFEGHGQAVYVPGQVLRFTSADDLWVFVNGQLAIEMAGIHAARTEILDLDSRTGELALTAGEVFSIDVFYAHRGTHAAAFTVQVPAGFQVLPPNPRPVAADDHVLTNEDQAVAVDAAALLANDTDPDGGALTVIEVGNPVNGAVALGDGRVVFTPAPNVHGTGSFTYTIDDGRFEQATATVTVDIAAVNDAPEMVGILPDLTLLEDAATNVATMVGLTNDIDGDPITYSVSSSATSVVTVSVDNTYRALFITPVPNASGSATVTVVASDGASSDRATFAVTVTPVNDAPGFAAVADATVQSGSAVVINVGGLNPGPDNEAGQQLTLTATSSDATMTGPIVVTGAGPTRELRFTPPARTTQGQVTLMLSLADDGGTAVGGQDRGSQAVTVTVLPVANRPPTIGAITAQRWLVAEAVSVPLTGADPDAGVLTWEAFGLPTGLTLATPGPLGAPAVISGSASAAGTGSATIRATDAGGLSAEVSFLWAVLRHGADVTVAIEAPDDLGATEVPLVVVATNTGNVAIISFEIVLEKSANLILAANPRCEISQIALRPLVCAGTHLLPGQSTRFTFSARRSGGGAASLRASLRGVRPGDIYPANNTAVREWLAPVRTVDLEVVKPSAPATVRPNQIFKVSVVVRNLSTEWESTGARLSMASTSGLLTFISGPCWAACTLTLAPGATRTIEFMVQARDVQAFTPRVAEIVAELTHANVEPTPINNGARSSVTIQGQPVEYRSDLGVRVLAPEQALLGVSGTVVVQVFNLGPDDLDGFKVRVNYSGAFRDYPLPDGSECVRSAYGGPNRPIECIGGALPVNGMWQAELPLPTDRTGVVRVEAVVGLGRRGDYDAVDPDSRNNQSVRTTTVRTSAADLALTLTGPALVATDDIAWYTATVRNNGPDLVASAAVDPEGFVVRSGPWNLPTGPIPSTTCQSVATLIPNVRRLSCPVVNLAPGQSQSVVFGLKAGVEDLTASARIVGNLTDPLPANNSASATTRVTSFADLAVSIEAPNRLRPNDPSDVSIVIRNLSTVADAQGIRVRASLEGALLVATGACVSAGVPGVFDCAVSQIAAGDSARLRLRILSTLDPGTVRIDATATTTSPERATDNNAATASVQSSSRLFTRPR